MTTRSELLAAVDAATKKHHKAVIAEIDAAWRHREAQEARARAIDMLIRAENSVRAYILTVLPE